MFFYWHSKINEIVQIFFYYLRAWHAGKSKWGSITDINSISIGIELDNNGVEPFPEPQINSLLKLLRSLKRAYNIPVQNFIGHGDISPKVKVDPSKFFPWKVLAEYGFGLWYDNELPCPPASFSPFDALRIIGYDIADTASAILAFKRHYIQKDENVKLSLKELSILYNLYKKE